MFLSIFSLILVFWLGVSSMLISCFRFVIFGVVGIMGVDGWVILVIIILGVDCVLG